MSVFAPKVSIVIPVYNGSDYLRCAIDSALAQTYPDIEVIVVNDGSNDGGATEAIALSYGDRIRYLAKANGGVATALNAGIAAMTGDYFSWLSHDDAYPPDKIAKQVAFLAGLDDREVVLFGDYTRIDTEGCLFHTVHLQGITSAAMPHHLYSVQDVNPCTLLIAKKSFEKSGLFPEHLLTTQDYDLLIRMAMEVPFIQMPGILAHSRQHAAQGSKTLTCHKKDILRFFDDHYSSISTYLTNTFSPNTLADAYCAILFPLARVGLYSHFFDALRKSIAAASSVPSPRRLSTVIRIGVAASSAIGQAALIRILPASIWQLRQQIRKSRGNCQKLENTARHFLRHSFHKLLRHLDTHYPLQKRFSRIYQRNIFGGEESRSGEGSSLVQTVKIRQALPELFRELGITSLLDAPCGDFHWMRHVDLGQISYLGIDIVPELIEANRKAHGDVLHAFDHINLVDGDLPTVDIILCRDCLVHLSHANVKKALTNFKRSGSTYLLTTTFTSLETNKELRGCWRALNLEKPPFNLPKPLRLINEGCTESDGAYADKSLGLWTIADLC